MVKVLLSLWILLDVVAAYPGSMSCDYTCMSGKSAGGAFGSMGITNFGSAPTGANCQITTNIPQGGYVAGTSYDVIIASTAGLARKLTSNVAGFGGQGVVDSFSKVTSSTHQWTATSAASASFKALCGAGGSIDQMWVADTVTVTIEPPAKPLATTCASNTTGGGWSSTWCIKTCDVDDVGTSLKDVFCKRPCGKKCSDDCACNKNCQSTNKSVPHKKCEKRCDDKCSEKNRSRFCLKRCSSGCNCNGGRKLSERSMSDSFLV